VHAKASVQLSHGGGQTLEILGGPAYQAIEVSGRPLGAVRLSSDSADDEIIDAVTIEGLDHPGDVRSDGLR
jgi:hypothetical protein